MLPNCFLLALQPSDNFKTSSGIVQMIMEPSAKVSGRTPYLKPIYSTDISLSFHSYFSKSLPSLLPKHWWWHSSCSRSRRVFRKRSFMFTYALIATAFGVGDESVQVPHDDRFIFASFILIMSAFYIISVCHLSGYVSAYYSIKTGNRVQTTSWLRVSRRPL